MLVGRRYDKKIVELVFSFYQCLFFTTEIYLMGLLVSSCMSSSHLLVAHDIDDYVIDVNDARRKSAKIEFGVQIEGLVGKESIAKAIGASPKDFKEGGSLYDKFRSYQRRVYNDSDTNKNCQEVPGAVEGLKTLRKEGIDQIFITSREPIAYGLAREWLEARGVGEIPAYRVKYSVGDKGAKAVECATRRVSLFGDDSLEELSIVAQRKAAPHILWLDRFGSTESAPQGIVKVANWREIVNYAVVFK